MAVVCDGARAYSEMLIPNLAGLPPAPEVAVIINVGTKYVATLALLSAMRHARVPVVVIDCESIDGSFAWFQHLMKRQDFYLTSAPLKQHGETLDSIFRNLRAERILLVDSDVELLNAEMISQMRAVLEASPRMYGSGYLHTARWLEHHYCTDFVISRGIGYYMERPWIPFALFRTEPVLQALSSGRSFMHRLVLNDVPQIPLVSRLLWKRFRFQYFRRNRLGWLDPLRRRYGEANRPCYVSYDTGADIHEFLTQQRLTFDGISEGAVPWSVRHFSGITRSVLDEFATADAYRMKDAHPIVVERLRNEYAIAIR